MAPDIEQSSLYKLLLAKPTVSNYLTHSKTSRKSPTLRSKPSIQSPPNKDRTGYVYIYIYTRFCSQLILELLSVESIRARQLCTNDSITGRDESLEISRPEIRALCISLSLFICTRLPTALLSRPFHFSFFPFLSSSHLLYIIAALASLFRFPSLSSSLPFFAPSTFIYPSNFFRSALALTHRKGGWVEVGRWKLGRAIAQNVDGREEERRG